jgi:hypothetical protein
VVRALKGDRKSYQMNPMNRREALRESLLDEAEGADALMVKPAGAYLDIIRDIREASNLPLAAYQVSGEYAMIKFGAQAGAIDEGSRGARKPGRDQARGCGSDLHLLCDGSGIGRDLSNTANPNCRSEPARDSVVPTDINVD